VIKFNQILVEIQTPACLARRTEYVDVLQSEKLFYLGVVNVFLEADGHSVSQNALGI
jgi:hypothetical protein